MTCETDNKQLPEPMMTVFADVYLHRGSQWIKSIQDFRYYAC